MDLNKHVCSCNEGCIINSKQSNFSVYGSKTNYLINNSSKKSINKYIVDDCVLSALREEEKCDYLFLVENSNKSKDGYFVELKGAEVSKAISQILNSIKHLGKNINGSMFGRIVCSKFHKAPNTFSSNNYIKLRKFLGENLVIKSSKLSDII
jgi:hypothetical protein